MKRLFGLFMSLFTMSVSAQDQKAKNAVRHLVEQDAIIKDRNENVYIKVDSDDPATKASQRELMNAGRTTRTAGGQVQINPSFLEELKSDPSFKEELNNADCCVRTDGMVDPK